jgi:hypothetical protein
VAEVKSPPLKRMSRVSKKVARFGKWQDQNDQSRQGISRDLIKHDLLKGVSCLPGIKARCLTTPKWDTGAPAA